MRLSFTSRIIIDKILLIMLLVYYQLLNSYQKPLVVSSLLNLAFIVLVSAPSWCIF